MCPISLLRLWYYIVCQYLFISDTEPSRLLCILLQYKICVLNVLGEVQAYSAGF